MPDETLSAILDFDIIPPPLNDEAQKIFSQRHQGSDDDPFVRSFGLMSVQGLFQIARMQRRMRKSSKKKRQTSKEISASTSAFAQSEWAFKDYNYQRQYFFTQMNMIWFINC